MSEQLKLKPIVQDADFQQSKLTNNVKPQNTALKADLHGGDAICMATESDALELSSVSDRQSFPIGDNLDEYIGWGAWSNVRWAWEFLRRNEEFVEFCDKVKTGSVDMKKCKRSLKAKFGLLSFKDCFEPFDMRPSFMPPRFVSAKVSSFSRVTRKQENTRQLVSKIKIRSGEVLIRFDVTQTDIKRSLNGQIAAATKLLKLREKQWLKRKEAEPGKPLKNNYYLLSLLRLLDVDKSRQALSTKSRLTNSDIYRMLYPFTNDEKNAGVKPDLRDRFHKEVKSKSCCKFDSANLVFSC